MKGLIYVAGPYTDPSPVVRDFRTRKLAAYTAKLLQKGKLAYCPVAHGHTLCRDVNLPLTGSFWKVQWKPFLAEAEELHILTLEGWMQSKGTLDETRLFKQWNPTERPLLVSLREVPDYE